MISVVVKGDEGYAERIISKLRWFTLAESLGGVESLVSQPFSMTHASIPLEKRLANGITPQLIRLSVGDRRSQRSDCRLAAGAAEGVIIPTRGSLSARRPFPAEGGR